MDFLLTISHGCQSVWTGARYAAAQAYRELQCSLLVLVKVQLGARFRLFRFFEQPDLH
jgi:hypothetical protein